MTTHHHSVYLTSARCSQLYRGPEEESNLPRGGKQHSKSDSSVWGGSFLNKSFELEMVKSNDPYFLDKKTEA